MKKTDQKNRPASKDNGWWKNGIQFFTFKMLWELLKWLFDLFK